MSSRRMGEALMGMWSCKAVCTTSAFLQNEKPDNWRSPFSSHSRCRKCDIWIRLGISYKDNRCPCCHGKLAMKPRISQKRKRCVVET